jgi:hypothetical protein
MKDYSRPKLRPENGVFLKFSNGLNKYLGIFLRLCESHALLNHVSGMYLVKFFCPYWAGQQVLASHWLLANIGGQT